MDKKDTLFGFEVFTDILTGPITGGPSDDDFSDEELEQLKKMSKKNRPSVNDVKNIDDDDVNGDDDDDDEIVEQDTEDDADNEDNEDNVDNDKDIKNKNKQSSKKSKVNVDNNDNDDNDDADDADDADDDEVRGVTALFDAIAEELDWDFSDEDEKKPENVEELVAYFKDVISQNSVPNYASEEIKQLDDFVRNGGKLQDYFTIDGDIDLDNFDTSVESNQKQIVKMLLTEKGFNDKQITRKLEKYEDAGILEDEAEDALEALKEITANKKEQLLQQQEKEYKKRLENQQTFLNSVVEEIKDMDNIRGIKIPEKDKRALFNYIFKTDADGKTQYQKDFAKSVKNLIESAYFTMKGDTLLNAAKKMGTTSAIKNLKQSLKSTGVGKTKRVNSTSSDSIFSRAVQLL